MKKELRYSDYINFKEQVLNLFEIYKQNRGNINDGIDLIFLESKIENLKKNEFVIAVAGEVKAGKSSFINSLIQEEILPVDVLQATNVLIEVFYSKKPFLKITYASGRTEILEEDSKEMFKETLRKVASIPDEYRDIPVNLIDLQILEYETPFSREMVTDEYIKYLEKRSGMDNLGARKEKIISYIESRNKDNIPIRIELGYPFPWKFEEIRIVDMPGVNAVGGVQDLAFSFTERANAILFIHPIKPVESESFKRFVTSVITNKSKEVLFLILTHSAVFFEEQERLLEEAKKIYSFIIPENRIYAVDNVLKLIYNDLEKGKTLEEIKAKSRLKRKWISYFKELAEEEGLDIKEAFLKYSGFKELLPHLEEFLLTVPFIELNHILEKLKAGYRQQISIYRENIRLLESQKRDPQEFLKEIQQMQKGLEEFEAYCYQVLEEATIHFLGINSPIEISINSLKLNYYEAFIKASNIEELRKYYKDVENELSDLVSKNLSQISIFFEKKLLQIGELLREEYKITIPKIDLESIEENCKQRVIRKEEIVKEQVESLFENWNFLKPWKWLKASRTQKIIVGTKIVVDEISLLKALKNDIIETFIGVIEKLRDEFYKAFEFYKKKIGQILRDKRERLEEMKKELKSNERIDYEILMLQKNIELKEREIRKIEAIQELMPINY